MPYESETLGATALLSLLLLALSSAAPVGASAGENPVAEVPGVGVYVPAPKAREGADGPPELDFTALAPLERLAPAAEDAADALDDLRVWNRDGRWPLRVGFDRPLAAPRTVVLADTARQPLGATFHAGGLLSLDRERAVWAGVVEVEDAAGLRARLRVDEMPAGTRVWTRGEDGHPLGPLGPAEVTAESILWLPPVEGPRLSIEIVVPREALDAGAALRVHLDGVTELVEGGTRPSDPPAAEAGSLAPRAATACEIDGRCVGTGTLSVIDDYRHAVARLLFSDGGSSYFCSGSLLNDTDESTTIPYLLTANHCFSTQASASSLVAYFDDFTSTCNGSSPSIGSLPRVSGSTLLATSSYSDFTLVRLSGLPSGYNYLLGWTDRVLVEGESLHMLSHPDGRRQAYSRSAYTGNPAVYCGFLGGSFYADQVAGSTLGGSSGAPAIVDAEGGQVVGQLYGACLSGGWSDCDYSSYNEVDGGFRATYPSVVQWLDPPTPTLTVEAIDDAATELGDPGAFRLTRTVDLASSLAVTVALSGTAANGTDYETLASPVTIPAGQASVDVPVIPRDDAAVEGTEEVTLSLVSAPGFEVAEPSTATVTLAEDDGPDCRSVAVASQTLGSGETSACGRLHAGPDLTVAGGADVGLHAGRTVVLYDGFATGAGASLKVATCGMELCSGSGPPSSSGCHPCVEQVCAADSYCCDTDWDTICVNQVASVCGLTCP